MNQNETEQNKRVNELVERSMLNLNEMVDANTVIGTPDHYGKRVSGHTCFQSDDGVSFGRKRHR